MQIWEKIKKVLIGALIAGAGAALTYLLAWVSSADLGTYGPLLGAFLSVLINLLRKLAEQVAESALKEPFEGEK